MKSQQITVQQGNQTPLVLNQNYMYDSLNRLKSAEEKDVNNAMVWKQTYVFDRYGNRNFDAANTTTLGQNFNANISNPTVNFADNRFTTGQGYVYDLSGNIIQDAEGRNFVYDAENKQKSVSSASNPNIGTYFFDGDGKRVKKISPTETTIYVYDAGGKLVAEYSTQQADTPKINYTTNDHLGSPRITTDQNGQVISRVDYQPYGEEIASTQRTANLGYTVQDNVKQGFTGYIKDDETGLDFAQARMYKNSLGRFTGADPLLGSGRPSNPKTWNRYTYVLNNPLKLVDPSGLISINHEDLHSGEGIGKKPKVRIVRKDTLGKPNIVNGNVNDAIAKANKTIDGKYAGKVASSITVTGTANKKGQYFQWNASAPDKSGNSQVTATLSDITITATTVTTLPKWSGYDSASTEDKTAWDSFMTGLKDHEDGHVEINKQEVEQLKADIEDVLPDSTSIRFTSKQSTAGAESERRLNFKEVDSAVQTGLQRHKSRQINYDNVSNHTLSPAQLKEKGIDY